MRPDLALDPSFATAYSAPMASTSPPAARYEELCALPENVIGEILSGELVVSPWLDIRQSVAASALGWEIGGAYQRGRGGPGGWWVFFKPELHLAGDVLVPDIAGWQRARMGRPPDGVGYRVPPDWVELSALWLPEEERPE